jgi:hypothetical protein
VDDVATVTFGGGRELGWYSYLVHNRTALGSLATLVHAPFMIAFLSAVTIGALSATALNPVVLGLSLLVVALLLYGEHMLDDLTRFGKPWGTVFSDRALASMASVMFLAAGLVGLAASFIYTSPIPFIGVVIGVAFCCLYGLEIWRFHEIVFGALGFAAIPAFSYLAQNAVVGTGAPDLLIAGSLLAVGFALGYVMLFLYECTKTASHRVMWRLLAGHFALIYAIVGVMVWLRL